MVEAVTTSATSNKRRVLHASMAGDDGAATASSGFFRICHGQHDAARREVEGRVAADGETANCVVQARVARCDLRRGQWPARAASEGRRPTLDACVWRSAIDAVQETTHKEGAVGKGRNHNRSHVLDLTGYAATIRNLGRSTGA